MKKILGLILTTTLLMITLAGCTTNNVEAKGLDQDKSQSIILSTTTSTENSGLLSYILPDFTEKTGIEVKVVAVGTGKALQMGRDGEADVLLVHAKTAEEKFVDDGHGIERFDVMYNDFVILGPSNDPAKLSATATEVIPSFEKLYLTKSKFVSRGDDSGTHKKELSLWKSADLTPEGEHYVSAGKGMGDVIQMADEMNAYTMADRATYLSMSKNVDVEVIVEGDPILFNQYGIMAVNPTKNKEINNEGASAFIEWILSDETQKSISGFGIEEFGQPLFVPNAN